MTKYSYKPRSEESCAKASQPNLRVHYKQMSEVGRAVKGLTVKRATAYLKRVLEHQDVIPYMRHKGGKGRHAQAKQHKTGGSGFPSKASTHMLKLLKNIEASASGKGLAAPEELVLKHVQVNRAPKQRRRTFRAHGRVGPYVRSPCHVELVAEPAAPKQVAKPAPKAVVSGARKLAAIRKHLGKVPVGGGLVVKQ